MDKTELPVFKVKEKTKLEKTEIFLEHLVYIFWLITSMIICISIIFGGLYLLIYHLILN